MGSSQVRLRETELEVTLAHRDRIYLNRICVMLGAIFGILVAIYLVLIGVI